MTTMHATYYLSKAEEAQKSDNPEVARLGGDLKLAIREIIELRESMVELRGLLATDTPERMLKALALHYKQRVAPVSEYCQAFDDWIVVCEEAAKRYDETLESPRGRPPPLYAISEQINTLRHLDIGKSSYLARRIYGGEKHRTRMCPVHQGRWSGLPFETPVCGCDLTGWLPEDDDAE